VLHGISFGPHSKSLRVRLIIKGLQCSTDDILLLAGWFNFFIF
jgi:hypothetical protein